MPTIGLCMIVKDEAHIIERCLGSAAALADYVLVVDTGSSDGTQDLIRSWLVKHDVPGVVLEEPWRDFAYNRSHALRCLRERRNVDYGLMIDADNVLEFDDGFDAARFKDGLHRDLYDVRMRTGTTEYTLPLLFRNRLSFRYRGVLHEFLDGSSARTRGAAEGFASRQVQDSARNKNPQKYHLDAEVLAKALETEQDPHLRARYTFYLGNCYKDAGMRELALDAYTKRAELGHWEQEVFLSLHRAAQLKEELDFPESEVVQSYLRAFEVCPRAEALHGAMRFCRLRKMFRQAYVLGRYALTLPVPQHALFVETWVYDYGVLDEFSIAAYWSGHYRESLDACNTLLANPGLPEHHRDRVRDNANFSVAKIGVAV